MKDLGFRKHLMKKALIVFFPVFLALAAFPVLILAPGLWGLLWFPMMIPQLWGSKRDIYWLFSGKERIRVKKLGEERGKLIKTLRRTIKNIGEK